MAIERLGAEIDIDGRLRGRDARRTGLRGGEIVFPKVTVGGTHTALMAASLANGTTVIENAAREPEIADVADCLNKMGARSPAPAPAASWSKASPSSTARGTRVLPDRIEAGTYAMAVAMTGGDVLLQNARPELVAGRARRAGADRHQGRRRPIKASALPATARGLTPVDVTTAPFPEFPTDLQAQFMALMTRARAPRTSSRRSSRTASCMCRNWRGSAPASSSTATRATIEGVDQLKGAPVMATDLRASVSLVIAALAAEGETIVNRVYHLDRGFERLEEKLGRCGAAIERLSG